MITKPECLRRDCADDAYLSLLLRSLGIGSHAWHVGQAFALRGLIIFGQAPAFHAKPQALGLNHLRPKVNLMRQTQTHTSHTSPKLDILPYNL